MNNLTNKWYYFLTFLILIFFFLWIKRKIKFLFNKILDFLNPTNKCPKKLLEDIMQYFTERNEDEGYYNI